MVSRGDAEEVLVRAKTLRREEVTPAAKPPATITHRPRRTVVDGEPLRGKRYLFAS